MWGEGCRNLEPECEGCVCPVWARCLASPQPSGCSLGAWPLGAWQPQGSGFSLGVVGSGCSLLQEQGEWKSLSSSGQNC